MVTLFSLQLPFACVTLLRISKAFYWAMIKGVAQDWLSITKVFFKHVFQWVPQIVPLQPQQPLKAFMDLVTGLVMMTTITNSLKLLRNS